MSDQSIGCTSKYLPSEMQLEAAEIAVQQNPVNRPANSASGPTDLILPPREIAVRTSRYWGNKGVKLTVGFLEPIAAELRNRIIEHANAWARHGNIQFTYSTVEPQVRITREQEGYWSYLGTDILSIGKNDPTMCLERFSMTTLETEFVRVVRHEFGHTLGFEHEHMRRAIIEKLDQQKTIAYFRRTQGWTPAMVMQQVLTPLAESSLMGTPDADETSIMTYALPGTITLDGKPILGGNDIAPQDAKFVEKIYPKQAAPPPPPEPVTGFEASLKIDVDLKRIYVGAAAGWTVHKLTGANDMNEQYNALALELEGAIPEAHVDEARASSIGGAIGAVLALAAALKTGDLNKIMKALRDLINVLLGDDSTEVAAFATKAAAFKIDWSRIIGVLQKLLPLILGA